MPKIRDQKLLYHLTRLENFSSILREGLLPRSRLTHFSDVADQEIIHERRAYGLENYVPFHWFAGNPFDGRVQINHPNTAFVLITVRRTFAMHNNWVVIPAHPLNAGAPPRLMAYVEGFNAIDWDLMDQRNYREPYCKNICMAECLSPAPVQVADFFRVYTPNEFVAQQAISAARELNVKIDVEMNGWMFK